MARLAGPTVAQLSTDYTGSSFNGFGSGITSKPEFIADVAGTITGVYINVNDFGTDNYIEVQLFKRTTSSGVFTLVGTGNTPTGTAAPQLVTLTITGDSNCAVGDEFALIQIGDVSATDGGATWRAATDDSVAQGADGGVVGIDGSFLGNAPATFDLDSLGTESAGSFWYQVDGTTGALTDLQASTEIRDSAGNLMISTDFLCRVTQPSLSGSELVAESTIQTDASGILLVDSQLLSAAGTTVWIEVRAVGEANANITKHVYPATVVDANV
jgi:hypothetical protein